MKCDDDTFVRLDSVLKEVNKIPSDRSLYIGNINYYHKPLRFGKWAVTYEVCSCFISMEIRICKLLNKPPDALWQEEECAIYYISQGLKNHVQTSNFFLSGMAGGELPTLC